MDKWNQYIAFLRGINVGGHRPIKMQELRDMLAMMGYDRVQTYIQSGNITFEAPTEKAGRLDYAIQQKIKDHFDYEVPTIVHSAVNLQQVLNEFPFPQQEGWQGYITFLSDRTTDKKRKSLETYSNEVEKFYLQNRVVYTYVARESKKNCRFSNSFIEKQLDTAATTRNLRTVQKVLDLANST